MVRPLVVDVAAADQMDVRGAAQQVDAGGQLRARPEIGHRSAAELDGRGGGIDARGRGGVGGDAVLARETPQRVGEQHVRMLGVVQHRRLAGV
ncbi:hypothetical protein ACFSSF_15155 [Dietzia aerolata]|uniref:hypothetical protein n=1 Tax=Dietzia aerolata TaxID=595984 RepID=UPI00362BB160